MRSRAFLGLFLVSCGPSEGGPTASAAPAPAATAEPPAWACELGPKVGGAVLSATVKPGRYDLEAGYSQSGFITMERTFGHSTRGRAWVDLGQDGSFEACIGVEQVQTSAVSQYASDDGQPHSSRSQSRTLQHLKGNWKASYDGARLSVTEMGFNDCGPEGTMSPYGVVQLVCGTLRASASLPTDALACRALGQMSTLENIGLELGSSRRAGSWTLRYAPMDRGPADPAPLCGPWLLLGAAPGLTVSVQEGDRDEGPQLRFTAGARPMVAADFQNADP